MPLINVSNYLCESWKWKITLDRIVRANSRDINIRDDRNNVKINEQIQTRVCNRIVLRNNELS